MKWRIRNLFRSLLRLLQYLPVIWKDKDWDYIYLLKLIEYKLSRMETAHRNDPHHSDHMTCVEQIKDCRRPLQRLIADDYAKEQWEEYLSLYPCEFIPLPNGNYRMKEMTEDQRALLKKNAALEEQQRRLDEELLFTSLKVHYRNWWL